MQRDSVDRHVEHWKREIPALDPLVEGVFTRIEMLLRHLKQTRHAQLALHGLEGYEYATLHFLGGCGPEHRATPSEIAAWQQMSPSGITGRLDALEKRGFIRRIPAPADRRKVIVELTDEGRRAWLSTFDPRPTDAARRDRTRRGALSGYRRGGPPGGRGCGRADRRGPLGRVESRRRSGRHHVQQRAIAGRPIVARAAVGCARGGPGDPGAGDARGGRPDRRRPRSGR